MPFANVYYPEGLYDQEELKEVSISIHQSLMEHFNVPKDDYFQLFLPYLPNQFYFNPSYLLDADKNRTEKLIHIFITCGPGRSLKQKRNLYQSMATTISNRLNISKSDIFIILNEAAAENWSFGDGKAQAVLKEDTK